MNGTEDLEDMAERHRQLMVARQLTPLFNTAIKENLLFFSNYLIAAFTAKALKKLHLKGYFLWGQINWELITKLEADKRISRRV